MTPFAATCLIAAIATAGIIARPWRLPEAISAVAGAALLVALGLLPIGIAWRGVAKGTDVYLFLIGMMLLAELARAEGLFDWLAGHSARLANGSAARLFDLTYLMGILVTIFLSNDATAVVLTPAIATMVRTVRAERKLPYLLIAAFIANAASFVLPISNPANLVIYGSHMPPLFTWLPRYALPSLLAIGATYLMLRLTQHQALRQTIATDVPAVALTAGGATAAIGIGATAAALMLASAFGLPLGWPTCLAGVATMATVSIRSRAAPWRILGAISWSVPPLVAGLFVMVEALDRIGLISMLSDLLGREAARSVGGASAAAGVAIAVASNLINNLPAGLIAGTAVQLAQTPPTVNSGILIGVDLGPNLSVTGSLATILWLTALRREGIEVGAWRFLKLGMLVMPPALILALAALVVGSHGG